MGSLKLKLDMSQLAVESTLTVNLTSLEGTVVGLSGEEEDPLRPGIELRPIAENAGNPNIRNIALLPREVAEIGVQTDGPLPQEMPVKVAGSPILRGLWYLTKLIAPTLFSQGAAFGAMYGATVAAANEVQSSNSPICLSAYLANVKANYEKMFGAGSFTSSMEQQVAQGSFQFPELVNASC